MENENAYIPIPVNDAGEHILTKDSFNAIFDYLPKDEQDLLIRNAYAFARQNNAKVDEAKQKKLLGEKNLQDPFNVDSIKEFFRNNCGISDEEWRLVDNSYACDYVSEYDIDVQVESDALFREYGITKMRISRNNEKQVQPFKTRLLIYINDVNTNDFVKMMTGFLKHVTASSQLIGDADKYPTDTLPRIDTFLADEQTLHSEGIQTLLNFDSFKVDRCAIIRPTNFESLKMYLTAKKNYLSLLKGICETSCQELLDTAMDCWKKCLEARKECAIYDDALDSCLKTQRDKIANMLDIIREPLGEAHDVCAWRC